MDMILTNDHAKLWLVGIPLLYGIVNSYLRVVCSLPKTVRGSNGPNMMAFDLVSCFCCFYVGVAGCMAWFNYCPGCDLADIESDKMYGRSIFFETHLGVPLLTYQLWNFLFSLAVKELRDPVSLLHHIASGLCAFFSMHPFLQYYGLFFYGVPEVSSVPLTIVSLSKSFPFIKEDYPRLHNIGKWTFGVLFIIIRLVMWTYTSAFYWIDIVRLLTSDEPPHSMFVVGFFCFSNLLLTSMQYFWGYKIIRQMLNGGHEVKKVKVGKEKAK
mmetsp:Transcript_26922/g.45449  ORF Transcript_26922/g.45449 Transcript_26922/m.45449 type:complete len:269 (-) Transcript_26922:213-1019(-)